MANCPKCGEQILAVDGEQVPIIAGGTSWRGVAYSCQTCGMLLGFVTDPIAIKTDIVDEILDRLGDRSL
jgi:hypothetical protein